jgi:hypothetical protein
MHTTFVINIKDPEAYLDLIRSPAKTVIQTGQVGAILLADALVVRLLHLIHVAYLNNLTSKVYRTFVLWNHDIYVIILPCLTYVATFSKV